MIAVTEGPTPEPLLVVGQPGLGRVVAFAGDSTWRWVLEGHRAAHQQFWRQVVLWLAITLLLGAGFIYLEIDEFAGMIAEGAGPDRSGFLSAFFTLVGTHGLHVTVGLVWILVMIGQVLTKGITAPVASRLMRLGLFWHFLDIIWVVIFSVVYLPGVL